MILESSGDIGQIDLEIIDTSIAKNNVRGKYIRYTDQQRFQIGKYASENGTTASVRKYRTDFPKINKSTVRGFKKHYEEELHRAKKIGREVSKKLPIEKKGPTTSFRRHIRHIGSETYSSSIKPWKCGDKIDGCFNSKSADASLPKRGRKS